MIARPAFFRSWNICEWLWDYLYHDKVFDYHYEITCIKMNYLYQDELCHCKHIHVITIFVLINFFWYDNSMFVSNFQRIIWWRNKRFMIQISYCTRILCRNIIVSYIYVVRCKLYSISPNYDKNRLRLTCKLCWINTNYTKNNKL